MPDDDLRHRRRRRRVAAALACVGIGAPQLSAPGQNLLNQAVAGSSGQQMQATFPLMAGAALYQLDAAEGAAVISQLKTQ